MKTSPSVRPPWIVSLARRIRHAPQLKVSEAAWNALRPTYHRFLRFLSRDQGLPIVLEEVGTFYVPASFLSGSIDELEIPMLKRFSEMLSPDSCLYDVGASVGLYSLVAAAKMGRGGEIHAFESDMPSCAKYWNHLELQRRRMTVYLSRCFVSDMDTLEDPLSVSPVREIEGHPELANQPGQHLYLSDHLRDREIPQLSLDSYVRSGRRAPSVIKCDIEGAEMLLLKGSAQVLQRFRPLLFISVHPDLIQNFNSTAEDLYRFLRQSGYKWEIVDQIAETHLYAWPAASGACE